eukprot:3788436-Rhodomonas_salina.2
MHQHARRDRTYFKFFMHTLEWRIVAASILPSAPSSKPCTPQASGGLRGPGLRLLPPFPLRFAPVVAHKIPGKNTALQASESSAFRLPLTAVLPRIASGRSCRFWARRTRTGRSQRTHESLAYTLVVPSSSVSTTARLSGAAEACRH